MRLIRVAVPVPALDALTYHVPDELGDPAIGARVLVPLGNRTFDRCGDRVEKSRARTSAPDTIKPDRRRPRRRAVPAGGCRRAGSLGL